MAFGDIMIGSPGIGIPTSTGQVSLIYGQSTSITGSTLPTTVNLSAIPSTVPSVTFTGPSAGSLAGYSISSLGRMVASSLYPNSEILIGDPGYNSNQGAVFLIPGSSTTLTGTYTLADGTQPVAATLITMSNTVGRPSSGPRSPAARPPPDRTPPTRTAWPISSSALRDSTSMAAAPGPWPVARSSFRGRISP